ncbi:Pimeloyl-ACP methyl ester carboxylesterase [Burkholderiales bacterium 8X]|nr:Pimeloyl-ACP methyl ester carboxylesterase [Burkholderiales bacterium 8X]
MTFHTIERLAVEDEGEGPTVVCVHGLGGSSNTWTPLMPALARHRVVRVDLPGSGRSQRAEGPLSIERYVEALTAVCERLGIARAHWLGHSMGTIVCQHIAARQPARVASMALFGPLIAPPDAARTAMKARAAKARDGAAAMQEITEALMKAAVSAETRQRQPVAMAFVRESLMRQDGDSYARSCEALAAAEPAAIENIEAPALLVTGDEDGVAPPQSVRAMSDRLHRAASKRVVVLAKCGHWTPVERPDECQRELREFLAAHARR